MNEKTTTELEKLREIIVTDISVLRGLLKQSEQLSFIIKTLENREENKETKEQLENLKCEIFKSVDVLFVQTENLFSVFEELVDLL